MRKDRFLRMSPYYEIDVVNHQTITAVDNAGLTAALEVGLQTEQVSSAVLSVSIVDNAKIHELNREHLKHDFPTDVISFQLDWHGGAETAPPTADSGRSRGARIEGEIVASAEYADQMAVKCGWTEQNELILYVLHGMLHICGYDDLTSVEKKIMRNRERAILTALKIFGNDPPGVCHVDSLPDSISETEDRR